MPPAPHRRAEPYLALHPERGHGYRVDDPPPPGWTRTVAVARIEEWSRLGSRAAYRVGYARLLRRGPVLRDGPVRTTFVVVERQPDGRWLVAAHLPHLEPATDVQYRRRIVRVRRRQDRRLGARISVR